MSKLSKYFRLTPEWAAGVQAGVRQGLSLAHAARRVGVPPRTVWGWLARGRKRRTGPHADLVRGVRRAAAEFLSDQLAVVQRAAGPTRQVVTRATTRRDGSVTTVVTERDVCNWRAAARLLSIKAPDEFGAVRGELKGLKRQLAELRRTCEELTGARTAPTAAPGRAGG